jgi:hypothetical protein
LCSWSSLVELIWCFHTLTTKQRCKHHLIYLLFLFYRLVAILFIMFLRDKQIFQSNFYWFHCLRSNQNSFLDIMMTFGDGTVWNCQ